MAWTVVGLVLVAGADVVRRGGPTAAWAALADGPVAVLPALIEVGDVSVGEPCWATVTVVNRGDREARLVGGTQNCAIDSAIDLPVTILSGGETAVRVLVKKRPSEGRFISEYLLYVDDGVIRPIVGRIAGRSR